MAFLPFAATERGTRVVVKGDRGPSVQVLQALYVRATRVTRTDAPGHDLASGLVRASTRFPEQAELSSEDMNCGRQIDRLLIANPFR